MFNIEEMGGALSDLQSRRELFICGQIAGLVEALDVTDDVSTIKKIANKLRIAAHEMNRAPPMFAPDVPVETK